MEPGFWDVVGQCIIVPVGGIGGALILMMILMAIVEILAGDTPVSPGTMTGMFFEPGAIFGPPKDDDETTAPPHKK